MDYSFDVLRRCQELGYDIDEITPKQEMELKMGLRTLIDATLAVMRDVAKNTLHKTVTDYLKNLKKTETGADEYIINLGDDAKHLEEGYGPFDMKPGLLHGPNAKISAKGIPYNIVPIEPEGGGKTEFRVVSGLSPKNSWMHPGFYGVQAFEQAAGYIEDQIDRMIMRILG